MAETGTQHVSSSICVHFPPEQCPRSFSIAIAAFGHLGEIARIDMSMGVSTGCLVVTFFDARCAEKALVDLKGIATRVPPAEHDFRTVRVKAASFADLPPGFTGFEQFGDIAGVTVSGQDLLVEFYDMRAAQQALLTLPGSHPSLHIPEQTGGFLSLAWPKVSYAPSVGMQPTPPGLAEKLPATARPTSGPTPGSTAGPCSAPVPKQAAGPGGSTGDIEISGSKASANGNQSSHVREKLDSKDLTKFDIVPEKIKNGQDKRTTVMIRNIPKSCSREAFVEALRQCGIDNYDFFYMPFDKRRDIHCGFAFVDFKWPQAVLQLHDCLRKPQLCRQVLSNGGQGQPLALSYARLQGQEQLMKHFSLSAVMYDNDARKRPIFLVERNGNATPAGPPDSQTLNMPAKVDLDGFGVTPKYAEVPKHVPLPVESFAFQQFADQGSAFSLIGA